MHTTEVGTTANVPAFLTKLWKLVEDPNYDHLIHWSQNGKSFIIRNQAQFAKELLPLYFKHNNMASFIRQLNMYGFRKLTNIENSGLRAEHDDIEFYHPHFIKDQESSLECIKRKIKAPLQVSTTKGIDENKVQRDDVGSILMDVKTIKGKQDTVDNLLVNMQKENEALWREIAILRQKHQKQQHIVEKLIQFLLSLVHQRGIGAKRKSPLMIGLNEINDSNRENSKAKRFAKEDAAPSPHQSLGPLIFDVSDDVIEDELEANANNCPIINTADLSPLTVPKSDSPVQDLSLPSLVSGSGENGDSVDALLDPLQSVIESSIIAPDDGIATGEIVKPTATTANGSNGNGSNFILNGLADINEVEVESSDTNEVLQPINSINLNGVNVSNSIKVIPSTSGGNIILTIEPSHILPTSIDSPIEVSELLANILGANFSNDLHQASPVHSPSPLATVSNTSPDPSLHTPLSVPENLEGEASITTNNTIDAIDRPSTGIKDLSNDDYTIENFNDHLDNIDLELNWLQEQLSSVDGLNFDPNSLMDLDLSTAQ